MNKSEIYWQSYLNLEKKFIEISNYVFITDNEDQLFSEFLETKNNNEKDILKSSYRSSNQLATFSPYIADFLVQICVQIESIAKDLYFANGGEKEKSRNLKFDSKCISHLEKIWSFSKNEVLVVGEGFDLKNDYNWIITPLLDADKEKRNTWKCAYQDLKHDRLHSLTQGSVQNSLLALGALYLLNIYYKKPSINAEYQDVESMEYSFGSKIFAIRPPALPDLNNLNYCFNNEKSPLIAKFDDRYIDSYNLAKKNDESKALEYLQEQPESSDKSFIDYQNQQKSDENRESIDVVTRLRYLIYYRHRHLLSSKLSFTDKKSMFINSDIWEGFTRSLNNPLKEDELTGNNIDKEIKKALFSLFLDTSRPFHTHQDLIGDNARINILCKSCFNVENDELCTNKRLG